MASVTASSTTWWGDIALQPDQWADRQVGPGRYVFHRLAQEWQIWSASQRNPVATDLLVRKPTKRKPKLDGLSLTRLGFQESPESINLLPVMADRPVVVLPEQPVLVPSGERMMFYVTTALRLQLRAPNGQMLLELPTYQPSDSWFGTPMDGELCYAGRTWAKTCLDALPEVPHRAITSVEVINRAASPLSVARLRLPTVHLALYLGEDQRFHTQSVQLLREQDDDVAKIDLLKEADGLNGQLISAARAPLPPSRRIPAFGWLFE